MLLTFLGGPHDGHAATLAFPPGHDRQPPDFVRFRSPDHLYALASAAEGHARYEHCWTADVQSGDVLLDVR